MVYGELFFLLYHRDCYLLFTCHKNFHEKWDFLSYLNAYWQGFVTDCVEFILKCIVESTRLWVVLGMCREKSWGIYSYDVLWTKVKSVATKCSKLTRFYWHLSNSYTIFIIDFFVHFPLGIFLHSFHRKNESITTWTHDTFTYQQINIVSQKSCKIQRKQSLFEV